MTQPIPTVEFMVEQYRNYREVARLQKRAEAAARDAAQAAAQTRDTLLEFCVAAGVEIKIEDEKSD